MMHIVACGQILSGPQTRKKNVKTDNILYTFNIIYLSVVIFIIFFHMVFTNFSDFDGPRTISRFLMCPVWFIKNILGTSSIRYVQYYSNFRISCI